MAGRILAGRILGSGFVYPGGSPEPGQPSHQAQDRQSSGTAIFRLCRQHTHTDTLANNTSISSALWKGGGSLENVPKPLHSPQPGLGALQGNPSPNLATENARHWSKRTLGCENAVEIGNKVGI